MDDGTDAVARCIFERWHEAVLNGDLDGLMELYAETAVLESPLIQVTLADKADGIVKGSGAIRAFFDAGFRKLGSGRARWYRTGSFFFNGRQLVWEYPRETPEGDQVDLVEMMDIEGSHIVHHRVYWGWVGFKKVLAAGKSA